MNILKIFLSLLIVPTLLFAQTTEQKVFMAISDGDIPALTALLDGGANPNGKLNDAGHTPIITAVFLGKTEALNLLIEKKADVNSQDMGGNTPLITAVFKNSAEMVKILIDAKADVNIKNKKNKTALGTTFMWKNKEIIELLKKAGAK